MIEGRGLGQWSRKPKCRPDTAMVMFNGYRCTGMLYIMTRVWIL